MSTFRREGKLVITCYYEMLDDDFARQMERAGGDPGNYAYHRDEPMKPFLTVLADFLSYVVPRGAEFDLTDFTVYTEEGYKNVLMVRE